jgi:hypothetical protein
MSQKVVDIVTGISKAVGVGRWDGAFDELLLRDVYANKKGNLESELEQTMSDIVSYLKKQYRKITGNTLSLKEKGEVDARVESTSRVRVFVTARKHYEISNMGDVEDVEEPSKDGLDKNFRKFLDQAATTRPKNDKRPKTKN